MSEPEDDHLNRAQTELGDPEALFQVSRGRVLAKLAVGVLLLVYGVIANYYWWFHGPAHFNHFSFLLLFALPLSGVALFWHMYRNRGLFVLIYPSGLLWLRRGEITSFPWKDIESVKLKIQRSDTSGIERGPDGELTSCWLPVDIPNFQLWNASMRVVRSDGEEVIFGPALSEYDSLAEQVQRRTFAALWPDMWERFRSRGTITFDELRIGPGGLRHEKKYLRWADLKEIAIAQGKLSIKQSGKWLPWLLKDVSGIPNPHMLFALVAEARRMQPVRKGSKEDNEEGEG